MFVFVQGAAITGYRDGVVHRHVLPPTASQSHEILSTTTRAVTLMDWAVVFTVLCNHKVKEWMFTVDSYFIFFYRQNTASGWCHVCFSDMSAGRKAQVTKTALCFLYQDRQAQSTVSATSHGWHKPSVQALGSALSLDQSPDGGVFQAGRNSDRPEQSVWVHHVIIFSSLFFCFVLFSFLFFSCTIIYLSWRNNWTFSEILCHFLLVGCIIRLIPQ